MLISTAAEMREIDRITIEDAGISGVVLMENAGRSAAQAVRELHQEIGGGLVGVLCGKGNNGGDGFVVARYLNSWDIDAACILITSRDEVVGDARVQLDAADTLGITVLEIGIDAEAAQSIMDNAVIYVDALCGTGLNSDLREPARSLVEIVNQSGLPVVALDLPTGISADTGRVLGTAVRADITITFGLAKRGLMVHPGCEYSGVINVVDIGIPQNVIGQVQPSAWTLSELDGSLLGPRLPNTHKGHYGHVLAVGGHPGKAGAVLLAAMGAMRSGAGLVTVATDARCQASLEGRFLELMVEPGWSAHHDKIDSADLLSLRAGKTAVVLGPGLPTGTAGAEIVGRILSDGGPPVVVDAGALSVLAQNPSLYSSSEMPLILTPHPGEAARFLGCTSDDIQSDRFAALEKLVELTESVVVLKGARSLVGAPGAETFINLRGNPGMATAGTGDVLAGVIGAFVARGLSPLDAAVLGTFAHSAAGDRVAGRLGMEGLIASDLLDELPSVIAAPQSEQVSD